MSLLVALLVAALWAPVTVAATVTKLVRYHGLTLRVPSGWPVFDLARQPSVCVRFNRHAVYLGAIGSRERCPGHLAGRTEAILVSPLGHGAADGGGSGAGAVLDPASGRGAQFVEHGLLVAATWAGQPQVIETALGLKHLPSAARPRPMASADRAGAGSGGSGVGSSGPGTGSGSSGSGGSGSGAGTSGSTSPSGSTTNTPAGPGQVYTGLGFDACSAPSSSQMTAWSASPFRAVGVYIGGANMACSQTNLTPSWVTDQAAAGWHLIPIYVGLQAPNNSCGCAAFTPANATSQGTAAAQDAVAQAQALGLGTGNPLYLDMEAYTRSTSTTTAVLDFIGAWTAQLHASGYLSGVYSSDNSGIADLASQWGTSYVEPDDLWMANWNGAQDTNDANVPATEWANHQRLHQYRGDHTDTYGGASMDIDSDYVDALTAAAGTTAAPAPSVSVAPASDGSITVQPSWQFGPQVSQWQVLAGASPTALSPAGTPVSAGGPIVVHSAYPYFAVSALDQNGQSLGTSAAVPTPSHIALVGSNVFVPTAGLGGIPLSCYSTVPCHVHAAIYVGTRQLVATGTEYVPVGGGLVYFDLSPGARRLVTSARHGQLAVTVRARDASGLFATRPMVLDAFSASGHVPVTVSLQSPSVQVLGLTNFVSNGWVGGVLTGCASDVPCHIATKLTIGSTVIAQTGTEYLGAHEMGYMVFTLTATGHAALMHSRGNQMLTRVNAFNGTDRASARISLIPYG